MNTKIYKQHSVDEYLKDDWLNRLNQLPWSLTSICYGHSDPNRNNFWVGFAEHDHPNLDLVSRTAKIEEALRHKEALEQVPNTLVHTKWVGFDGSIAFNSGYVAGSFSRLILGVDSTLKNTTNNKSLIDQWWEDIITQLEKTMRQV